MEIIFILVIIVLFIEFMVTKLSLTAYVAWMEENHFVHPSDKDMQRLVRWCVKKYLEDLFGRS